MHSPRISPLPVVLTICVLAAALHASSPPGQVVETDEHIITTLADGLYVLRHTGAGRRGASSGSTTVVVGDREVLVVDSGFVPSVARADIAVIRKWTAKPVKYLVNTHWHGDHTWGNSAYVEAFPGITIVSHTRTPELMTGYLTNFVGRNVSRPVDMRRALETGIDLDGERLSDSRRKEIESGLPHSENLATEFKALTLQLPTMTFDRELTIDLGNRLVVLKHLGRGNTSSDTVVWLPKERVAVTGDLLVYPNPFFFGGFPSDWSITLKRILELEPVWVVPGHGAVLNEADGRAFLTTVKDWLASVSGEVRKAVFRFGNLPGDNDAARQRHFDNVRNAVLKSPEMSALRERVAGTDAARQRFFDQSLPRIIESAYRELWGD